MRSYPRAGFSLIEVLVAISLAGVITALAFLLLHTTSQVSSELHSPLMTPTDGFRSQIRREVDQLLPDSPFDKQPSVELSPESGLILVSLLPDANGIPHPMRVSYFRDGRKLIRISEGGIPSMAVTNTLFQAVQQFRPVVIQEAETYDVWPEKKNTDLPDRLEITLSFYSEPDFTATWDLPAAYRLKREE